MRATRSAGRGPWLSHNSVRDSPKAYRLDVPKVCEEQVDVVDVSHLLYEGRNALDERVLIMLHEDIQVDPVLPTSGERLAVIPTTMSPLAVIITALYT